MTAKEVLNPDSIPNGNDVSMRDMDFRKALSGIIFDMCIMFTHVFSKHTCTQRGRVRSSQVHDNHYAVPFSLIVGCINKGFYNL